MGYCQHTRWLRLWKTANQVNLEVSDRPQRIVQEAKHVDEPAHVAVFIGNETKSAALNACGMGQFSRNRTSHGEFHLRLSQIQCGQHVIVVDGDVPEHNQLPRSPQNHFCHENYNIDLAGACKRASSHSDEVYHKILSPVADVICLFSKDIGGVEKSMEHLICWAKKGLASRPQIPPTVMLVVNKIENTKATAMIRKLSCEGLSHCFRNIHVVCVDFESKRTKKRSQEVRSARVLKKRLLQSLEVHHRERQLLGLSFSILHTIEFLCAAARSIVVSPWKPIDFLGISRSERPVDKDLAQHLKHVLQVFSKDNDLKIIGTSLIASSFILDHYVPEMHRFKPEDVFDGLYRDTCVLAFEWLNEQRALIGVPPLEFDPTRRIRENMTEIFKVFERLGSSKEVYLSELNNIRGVWTIPSSESTCFGCLRRKPQYYLGCGHWICQTCVRIFYGQQCDDPWLFEIDSCILCGVDTDRYRIRVKPDTAQVRVLSIDGGGARGRGPLEFLSILQQTLDLPYPVQRHFDVVFGTSSGAMSACALCINGWPIEKCIEYFETTSHIAFENRRLFRCFKLLFGSLPVVSSLIQIVTSIVVDSKYSAKKLEIILKDMYGHSRSIADSRFASEMGILLGVTVTSTDDTNTYIVTNYNGIGGFRGNRGYDILPSQQDTSDVPLWEILRCCTAAPYYFTPYSIGGELSLQDGGLTVNNPSSIAVNEVTELFPTTPEPSIVVSLGTGSGSSKIYSEGRGLGENSFPARLFRALSRQGNSAAAWEQLLGHRRVGATGQYFRFDVEFGEDAPALDDVKGMAEVARMARQCALESRAMERLAKCVRAQLFVFELSRNYPPKYVSGAYQCTGYILCRFRAGTPEFNAFIGQLKYSSALLRCRRRALYRFSLDTQESPDNLWIPVALQVPNRHFEFEISLQEGEESISNISGSPFTLEKLLQQQKIESVFGTDDHRKRKNEEGAEQNWNKKMRGMPH